MAMHSTDVSVSLPATIIVGEGEGMVEVCATLSAMEDTERNFMITLTTDDDTGELLNATISVQHCVPCSNKCF